MGKMDSEWGNRVRKALVPELSMMTDGWHDTESELRGPSNVAVLVDSLHDGGPGHIDIGFALNRVRPDAPVIWDCTSGGTEEDDAAAGFAARLWARTTAPVLLELL